MYPNMFNRDEIFFRLGVEKSEELLEKTRDENFKKAKEKHKFLTNGI